MSGQRVEEGTGRQHSTVGKSTFKLILISSQSGGPSSTHSGGVTHASLLQSDPFMGSICAVSESKKHTYVTIKTKPRFCLLLHGHKLTHTHATDAHLMQLYTPCRLVN